MSNFLVATASPDRARHSERMFDAGRSAARALKMQEAASIVRAPGVHAASFPRVNGTGAPIAVDPATGSWLLAAGTWFGAQGLATGSERALLRECLERGSDACAGELEGYFAIVFHDGRTGVTTLITDPAGTHHVYARIEDGSVVLSGSSLVLAAMGPSALDPVGVQEFLRTGTIYENRTVHRDVRRLDGGTIYRFHAGKAISTKTYWRITDVERDRLDGDDAADALAAAIGDYTRKVQRIHARVLCDLTGGYDSRALVAGCLHGGIPFKTTVTGTAGSSDVSLADRLASVAGIEHSYIEPQVPRTLDDVMAALPFTDGEYDLVEYAQILAIHRQLMRSSDVSINGSAGEIGRGRLWMFLLPRVGRHEKMDARRLVTTRLGDHGADPRLFGERDRLDLASHFVGVVERTNDGLTDLPNTLQLDHYYLMRMRAWQGRIASSTDQLWPCLSPFLSRSILDCMLSMTVDARWRSLVVRRMLARTQPALARVPLSAGYPPIPFGPTTAHRFWRLPIRYGQRVAAKAARMAGLRVKLDPTAGVAQSPRERLTASGALDSMLRPADMHSATMLDPLQLQNFLSNSRGEDFRFDAGWARLVSLESMLRRLDAVRGSHLAAEGASSASYAPAGPA